MAYPIMGPGPASRLDESPNASELPSVGCFIGELPTELLLRITLVNAEDPSIVQAGQDVRSASQVCRHWRDITLNSPVLWSRILSLNNMPSQWFEEVMHRTASVPLTIHYSSAIAGAGERLANLLQVREASCRVKTLLARFDHDDGAPFSELLDALKDTPMPSLERFDLYLPENDIYKAAEPMQLFGNSAPSLRFLSLDGVVPHTSSSFFKTLTTLHFKACPMAQGALAEILKQAPMLQALSVRSSLQQTPLQITGDNSHRLPSTIHFAHLKALTISERFGKTMVDFLACLRLPSLMHLYIFAIDSYPGDLWDGFLENVIDSLCPLASPCQGHNQPLASLVGNGYNMEIGFGSHIVRFVQHPSSAPGQGRGGLCQCLLPGSFAMQIAFNAHRDFAGNASLLLASFVRKRKNQLSACRRITLRFDEGSQKLKLSNDDRRQLLLAFATVPHLHLVGSSTATSILRFLTATSTSSSANSQATLLPGLKALGLPVSAIATDAVFLALGLFITQRRRVGHPISNILLTRGNVDLKTEEARRLFSVRMESLKRNFRVSVGFYA